MGLELVIHTWASKVSAQESLYVPFQTFPGKSTTFVLPGQAPVFLPLVCQWDSSMGKVSFSKDGSRELPQILNIVNMKRASTALSER